MNKSAAVNRRILPPTLLLICLLVTIALRLVYPGFVFFSWPAATAGGLILVAGLVITTGGSQQFRQARTPVSPLETPEVLVTEGFYRYTRNPMYLGFALVLAGVWLMVGAVTSIAGPLIFISFADQLYIPEEEKTLVRLFGQAYRDYEARVRRWI